MSPIFDFEDDPDTYPEEDDEKLSPHEAYLIIAFILGVTLISLAMIVGKIV